MQLVSARAVLHLYIQWSPSEFDKLVPLTSMASMIFLRLLGKLPFTIAVVIWMEVLD